MDKRALKQLLLDFERLQGDAGKYVFQQLTNYMNQNRSGCMFFCLEEVIKTRPTDPVLQKLREWIDQVTPDNQDDAASFAAKMCRTCHKKVDSLKKCARCTRVYYCSKECQCADWKTHKATCLPPTWENFVGIGTVSATNVAATLNKARESVKG